MLPRVSAALSQFIRPITSSAKQATIQKKPDQPPFERFQKQGRPNLRQVHPSAAEQQTISEPAPEKLSNPPAPVAQAARNGSVTQTFLQLVTLLHQTRHILMGWGGFKAYFASSKDRKKFGKIRKGAMLDTKAE